MLHSRMKRVEENILHALNEILNYRLEDPRVVMPTVTSVKVSRDLREAVVHVSILEDDPARSEEAIAALEDATGFIKRELADRVRMKRLPHPKFFLDTSTRDAFHLMELIEQEKPAPAEDEETDDAQGHEA